jgi:spermidine synthase
MLPGELPEVHFSDWGDVRHLHLGTDWIQGSMRLDEPLVLELDYVQRMMAWLLFVPPTGIGSLHAMQLGLGAGALTKFTRKVLRMRTTVVEINPHVVAACRLWFKLPPEDTRLSVVLGDAGEQIRRPEWAGTVDALQVDLYDHEAAAPVLDSEAFYADCRALLTETGSMTVNLFGRSSSFDATVARLTAVFGVDAVWAFKPTREGNTVVLARRSALAPGKTELAIRAEAIQSRWGLPAKRWLKVFKPLKASTA